MLKMNKRAALVGLVSLVIGVSVGYWVGYDIGHEKAVSKNISSYEDCAKAGYPIMESYPAQCNTPDGRHFIQKL